MKPPSRARKAGSGTSAASSLSIELFPLRSMFLEHAGDEHRDYQMIERDFVAVGGTLEEITSTPFARCMPSTAADVATTGTP